MEQFANQPITTLASAITSTTATTLSVSSATLFPTTGVFRLLIDSELLKVTAVSGNTFTVVRGDASTTPSTHPNGSTVTAILTKQAMDSIVSIQSAGTEVSTRRVLNFISGATVADNSGSSRCDITIAAPTAIAYGPGASRPAPGNAGSVYIPSDGVMTAVDTGSAWVGLNPGGLPLTIPPVKSAWTTTLDSVPNAVVTDMPGGGINMKAPVVAASAWSLMLRTLSSGTSYTVTTCLKVQALSASTDFTFSGITVSDGSNQVCFCVDLRTVGTVKVSIETFTNAFASLTDINSTAGQYMVGASNIWLQIVNDGTHRTYNFSLDGLNWSMILQEAFNAHISETKAGIFHLNATNSVGSNTAFLSWSGA